MDAGEKLAVCRKTTSFPLSEQNFKHGTHIDLYLRKQHTCWVIKDESEKLTAKKIKDVL